MLANQIDRDGPKRKDGQRLVSPSKVAPNDVEAIGIRDVIEQQQHGGTKQRDTDPDALDDGLLLQMDEFCDNQSGRTQGRVTTGNRCSHNTQQGQKSAKRAQPTLADCRHHLGSL